MMKFVEDIFLKLIFNILKIYNNLPFLPAKREIENVEKVVTN